MKLFISLRVVMLAALGLSWVLLAPATVKGFGPGQRVPTVTTESPSRRIPDSGRRPSPGFNPGFYIRPPRVLPRRNLIPESPPAYLEVPDDEPPARQPRREIQRRVHKPKPVKLAGPYIPYLHELAMDMDPALVALVARDPVKAVRTYGRAFARAKKSHDLIRLCDAHTNLGHVYFLTGRFDRAADHYAQAAALSMQQKDSVGEGIALRNLGATFIASADHRLAHARTLAALERLTSLGRARDVQMALNNLGVLEKNRASYRGAESYLEKALAHDTGPNDVRMLVQRNLGRLHARWGEYDRAIDDFTAYGNTAASLGDKAEVAQALLESASVYRQQGQHNRALLKVREAIRVQSAAKQETGWSKKLMGDILLDVGRNSEAMKYVTESGYDSSAGLLNLLTSQPHKAKKHYERLLEAADKEQNLDEMFTAHTGLGRAYESLHDYSRADRHYARAVEITEDIRASLLFSERRNFFAERINGFARSEPAKGLARVALKQKHPERGVYAGEVTKARTFADNLSQRTDAQHFGVPAQVLQEEADLTNKVAALKTALHAVPSELDRQRFQDMLKDIREQDVKRKSFVRNLCERFPDYCAVKYPEPVRVQEAAVKDTEYVLVFDVLGDSVGITLLRGRRIVRSALVPCKSDDLDKQIGRLRKPFEQVQFTRYAPDLAGTLYDKLLAEALKSVPHGSAITIIPDGALALLPFEALVVSGKPTWIDGTQGSYPKGLTYVADRYPISYYQSLTAMTLVRTLAKKGTHRTRMLVMADPVFEVSDARFRAQEQPLAGDQDRHAEQSGREARGTVLLGVMGLRRLPESEKLAQSMKDLLGPDCQSFTGLACTKQRFLQTFNSGTAPYSAVVFGTHGFAANDLPGVMEPALAMTMVPRGTDGLLTMTEVAGLTMDVDTAALTACKTGLGMRLAGEGVLSMGRAFQAAGTKSVIMSLWSVAEEPSIALMDEFFRQRAQGRNKLDAWTGARAHIRGLGFEHPFFWASFILVGETQ